MGEKNLGCISQSQDASELSVGCEHEKKSDWVFPVKVRKYLWHKKNGYKLATYKFTPDIRRKSITIRERNELLKKASQ